jgi:hypothetical protein
MDDAPTRDGPVVHRAWPPRSGITAQEFTLRPTDAIAATSEIVAV